MRAFIVLLCLLVLAPLAQADKPPVATGVNRRPASVKEWVVKGALYTHRDASVAIATDLQAITGVQIGKQDQLTLESKSKYKYIRYISLHNIPRDFRKDYYNIISFLLNSLAGIGLSDKPPQSITRPAWGGVDNPIIRVDLLTYNINPKAWERLGEKDPYFHTALLRREVITKEVEDGPPFWNAREGKWQVYVKTVTVESEPEKIIGTAAWCDPAAMTYTVDMLQSTSPVLRGDWFIRNVTIEPHYSDFLGIKTLADFNKLVGFDPKAAKIKNIRATVVNSGSDGLCPKVAQNNRVLIRTQTFNGYYWQTADFKTSIGEQNVINNFILYLKGQPKRDAGEYIATMPNGLQAYFLVNGNNEPVAAGDTEIVKDSMGDDGIVRNGRSCIYCHAKGINAFKSQFKRQVGTRLDQADLGIFDPDPVKALQIRQDILDILGSANFDEVTAGDSQIFAKSVAACNDMDAQANGLLFKQIWERYFVEHLDRKQMALELGLYPDELDAAFALRFEGKSNGVLIQALLKPPEDIRRDQWEEAFHEAALLSDLVLKGRQKK